MFIFMILCLCESMKLIKPYYTLKCPEHVCSKSWDKLGKLAFCPPHTGIGLIIQDANLQELFYFIFFICIKQSIICIWLLQIVSCKLCSWVSNVFREVLLEGFFFSSFLSLHNCRIVVLSCLVDSNSCCCCWSSSFLSFSESDEAFEIYDERCGIVKADNDEVVKIEVDVDVEEFIALWYGE